MTGRTKLWKAAAKHAFSPTTHLPQPAERHPAEKRNRRIFRGLWQNLANGCKLGFWILREDDPMPQTITQTVTDYVHAMAYADESLMRDVFDPRASIVGTFEGEIEWLSLEDFVDQMRKSERGLPDHDPAFEIMGIDKEGDSASVKLTTRFDGMDFYEYLSLLERDGNWSIVHKLYHIKP